MSLEDLDTKVRQRVLRRLKIAVVLCGTFLIVEAVGGWIAGSLAILSDAAHLFSDLVAFIVAIAANHLASLPPSHQHTYGLKRIESLAALLSMLSLAMVCVWLAYEAVYRLLFPPGDIDGPLMSGIAFIGVCVNVTLALVLGEHHVHLPGADHGHDHDHDHDHGHHHHHHHDNHDDDDDEEHQKHSHKSCSSHNHNHHHNDENGAHHEHDHNHHQHEVDEQESHSHGHHDHDDSHQHKEEEHHHHDHGHCHDDDHEKLKLIGSNSENGYGSTTLTTQSSGCCEHDHDDHDDHDKPPQAEKKSLHDNVNMRAAYIHVLGDLLQSVAVLVAGIFIWLRPDWKFIDPICTLFFCLIVFYATLGIMRSAIAVLIEEIPAEISWKDMYDSISNVEGVTDVHDLHIWSISQGEPALSVHCKSVDNSTALSAINDIVKKSGIKHATVQIQPDDGPCVTCNGNGCHSGDMALEV